MAVSLDLPKNQRAIVANDQLDYCVRDDVPVPPLRHDCIIIKTEFVGLNPVDTKMVGPFVGKGAIYGVSAPLSLIDCPSLFHLQQTLPFLYSTLEA